MTRKYLKISVFIAVLLFGGFDFSIQTNAEHSQHVFPKRANYYLTLNLRSEDIPALARWDLLVLNIEQQALHPELLRELRRLNPRIILLANIAAADFPGHMEDVPTVLPVRYRIWREGLERGAREGWFVHRANGERVRRLNWPNNELLLNITDDCPAVNGEIWRSFLARFIAAEVIGTGLWDGIFFDNTWDNVSSFVGGDVDFNRDGAADSDLDQKWRSGLTALFAETRRLAGRDLVIVGNNDTTAYGAELNGMMVENFGSDWVLHMNRYHFNNTTRRAPLLNIVNANTDNQGDERDYQAMRFGLASALMEDGYYSFDFGDRDHGQLWWYDEYSADLGRSLGTPSSSNEIYPYAPDAWRRPFEHGMVVLNGTTADQVVPLGAEYEKIHGRQDRTVNDGAIVDEVEVGPRDGQILLNTIKTLPDVVYTNGHFVRFLRPSGERPRHGLFLFDDAVAGGAQIAYTDLNGDGRRDDLVAYRGRLSVFRDDGQSFFSIYPFSVSYQREFSFGLADMNGDGQRDIVVAPESGVGAVQMYNYGGEQVLANWFPFGKKFSGGIALAVGDVDRAPGREFILSPRRGPAVITIYDQARRRVGGFSAAGKQWRGTVSLASGDLDGDGQEEIIVGLRGGPSSIIKIFRSSGKQIGPELRVPASAGSVLDLGVADVDFDGRPEIVAMTSDAGL
ncbi:MAG: VCBS repeat-containing protein [Candidatus Magasanikbacteria bacterium]|nr:VCBS repeat-containing protein [Candidatus Magasanikbacteria bacterium]